ncbi:Lar family restriction alleviation protein [Rhizobium sp. MHM7A]|uniref:Lar family restriction alleviation protein n=1 Tax=Rhizobium sp. MHM7A TaxID=2583233 RepID=UPI0011066232|nr:Lar family restriction alleviation protein [Rhizobium sp. MHM7A]TLX16555.1 hypothetical protein FFR93_04245 [Rhizobium sp. MHM7A]
MIDQENEVFAALVRIIDPRAYDIWEAGNLDPGSTSDKRWKAAKDKAEAILRLVESSSAIDADPLSSGHRECPFCGGKPRLCDPSYDGPADCWDTYVECKECDARSPGVIREHGDDEEWAVGEAWLQWDRRVVDDARLLTSTSETFIKALDAVVSDTDLATRLWASVLSVAGTKPIGWTQPGEIERVQSGESDVSAQFWPRRDMSTTRSMLAQFGIRHEVPDDVPLFAAPITAMMSDAVSPTVADLSWSVGGEGDEETHFVETIIGRYAAWIKKEEAHVFVPGAIRSQVVGSMIEDALQFAQRHFAERILDQLKR